LNAAEVARLLHVDRATVARWIKKGLLRGAIRAAGKQQWRIPLSSYEQLRRGTVTAETALADDEAAVSTAMPDEGEGPAGEKASTGGVRYARQVQIEHEL
jgi:hypothetical protein